MTIRKRLKGESEIRPIRYDAPSGWDRHEESKPTDEFVDFEVRCENTGEIFPNRFSVIVNGQHISPIRLYTILALGGGRGTLMPENLTFSYLMYSAE